MNQSNMLRRRSVQSVGPSAAILILYVLLFHLSLGRQYKQESVKLNKLESATKLADVQAANQQLASLQSETEKLNELLRTAKGNHQNSGRSSSSRKSRLRESDFTPMAVANLVELLEQNVCLRE